MKPTRDTIKSTPSEGYIYTTYGHPKYLKYALASVETLRRYDPARPIALVCVDRHIRILKELNLERFFDDIVPLEPDHASIVGFKHNVHRYMLYDRNLFLDSDIIWCKDPDPLWTSFSVYPFTVTGTQVSDSFFGGPKHLGVLTDILLQKRQRTLEHFGLTYLSRVQTGMMYAESSEATENVCRLAARYLERISETHFRSRLLEAGRDEESCEWSMAMAMSKLDIPVYPWLQGHSSPQLDFIESYTAYDLDFYSVICTYYSDNFVYNLRGLRSKWLRRFLINLFSLLPGKGDSLSVTPYCLHFGWVHQKEPFYLFSE
ncbi:MAG: hypothetical protein WEC12_03215, partial [Balneolaceae bacterium]